MSYRFKKKKKSEKTSADLLLDKEIDELERAADAFVKSGQPVPDTISESLSKLKAKRNPNKINARKFIYGAIEYDSVREARFAEALDKAKIPYEYQVEIELQPAFKLEHENIQDICIVADFVVDGQFIVDIKGHIMPIFNIKWKMLKHKFQDTREYFIINKDSDITGFIALAKSRMWKENTLNL